jgi:SAM-dependent methyltransferase
MALAPGAFRPWLTAALLLVGVPYVLNQVRKPTRWVGRFFLWTMNRSHSGLTDWGLGHAKIGSSFSILDVGCGGGRTVRKLAATATQGKVYGVDYSPGSVAASRAENASAIREGRVEIREAPVSRLPFLDRTFDLVTAVETHYYWPDLTGDLREIFRVMKPGGSLLVIAESYLRSGQDLAQSAAMGLLRAKQLTAEGHREWLAAGGFSEVQVWEDRVRGWLCVSGRRPPPVA